LHRNGVIFAPNHQNAIVITVNDFSHLIYRLDLLTVAKEREATDWDTCSMTNVELSVGFGQVVLLENQTGGNCIYLHKVGLLEFVEGLETALLQLKSHPGHKVDVMDTYQTYCLWLSVEKNGRLLIQDSRQGVEILPKLDHFRQTFHSYKTRFWREFQRHYPEVVKVKDFQRYDATFQ